MLKRFVCMLAALFVAGMLPVHAQDAPRLRLSQADWKALTDARIGVVKAALQLTPEQTKLWPAVEDAIRANSEARYQRAEAVADRLSKKGEINPIDLFRARADAMAQRAAGLKKLVDAWAPLYNTLSDDQKQRMRFLVVRVVRELRPAVEVRRMRAFDEEEEDEGE